jgi:hypothetical protein
MPNKGKSEAAFVMAMDMHGFSTLSQSDHDKVIDKIYREMARILGKDIKSVLDKKTIGDGFMFYFRSAPAATTAALKIRRIFTSDYLTRTEEFKKRLTCRIALHFGQFFWFWDAIEKKDALFGRNIIVAARLEPIVRENEIWCTRAFLNESSVGDLDERLKFQEIGRCEMAKGWKEDDVYALWNPEEEDPPKPFSHGQSRTIKYNNRRRDEYHFTYFALIRLKNRSDGVVHLHSHFENSGFHIDAVYYVFGNYDILARFKTKKPLKEGKLSKLLKDVKISHKADKCKLTEVHFNESETEEPIVVFPRGNLKYLKAFTYIKSSTVVKDKGLTKKILSLAKRACGEGAVVTYYNNDNQLIWPIAIPVERYYTLAEAIEDIESFLDDKRYDDARVTTYPVHGFEENFETKPNK